MTLHVPTRLTLFLLICALWLWPCSTWAQDAISLDNAAIYNSPHDVPSWPMTTAITRIEMRPSGDPRDGLALTFDAAGRWPDYTPPGWQGPIQYTVWAFVNINGQWIGSGVVQMWRGRPSTGAAILVEFARNWMPDGRYGPAAGHQPTVGESMGFMVTAGNARGVGSVTSVRERSNVVLVSLPAGDTGVFAFAAPPTQPPVIVPPVTVPPVLPPIPPPVLDLSRLEAQIEALTTDVAGVRQSLEEHRSAGRRLLVTLTKYLGPAAAALIAGMQVHK